MKNTFNKYFIVIAVLLVLAACQNPSDSSVYMAPGSGLVSLTINKVDTARTILPNPKLSDFEKIELNFTPTPAGIPETYEWTNNPISLAAGPYVLVVTAYADTYKQKPAAKSDPLDIVVPDGGTVSAAVTLKVTFGEDSGTFSWNITYSSDVTASTATMTITPINPTGAAQIVAPLNNTDSLTLNSGEYRVEFSLRDDKGRTAELTEILHVYKNLTSTFDHEFKTANFHFLKIKQVIFPEGEDTTATVSFDGLTFANIVYLVKVNTTDAVVEAEKTGDALLPSPPSLPPSANPPLRNTPGQEIPELPRMGHPEADKFNVNPPTIVNWQGPQGSLAQAADVSVGATRSFWVEEHFGKANWVQKQAALLAQGTYSNIWVIDESINITKAQAVAEKFDVIYLAETNILGYEYGGGPGGNGGIDSDKRIQILFYPIVDELGVVQAGGYFWAKDYYPENYYSTTKSNEAEIFYIDSSMDLFYTYSSLAHEFQHMINFNRKNLDKNLHPPSWYNEMLSVMTEDVMADIIGIPVTSYYHSIHQRIPIFLSNYNGTGITEWSTLSSVSYANAFGFGAYLMRNYGGVELLGRIMANNAVGITSITTALNEIYEGMTFEQALARFGETLVFNSPEENGSVVTFNKAIDDTIAINSTTAYTYTAPAIDVRAGVWNTRPGYNPTILDLTQREMRPSSVSVHTDSTWTDITGNKTITLQKPANGVIFFLMVR